MLKGCVCVCVCVLARVHARVCWLIFYKPESCFLSTCLLTVNRSGLEAGKLLWPHLPALRTYSFRWSLWNHRPIGQLDEQGRIWWPVAHVATVGGARREHRGCFWFSFLKFLFQGASELRKLLSSPNWGRWRWEFCREAFPLNQGQSYPSPRIRQKSADLHSCLGSLFSVFTTLLSGPSLNFCSCSRT